jgi:hypothetical protein
MQTNSSKTTKIAKDFNLATRTRLLLNCMRFMPICAIIGLATGGLTGLVFALPGGFALAVMVDLFLGAIGSRSANLLYGMGRRDRRPRDQFTGTLNQVRYHKMCKDFSKALLTVEDVLARDPDFAEALLLKAQILWEGFEDAIGAKQCLITILKVEPDKKSPFHRWALVLYKEISNPQPKPIQVSPTPSRFPLL